ncbi:phospholipid scramblase-related protein [Actinomadura kijaniata]|uniref:phospholipid scramblase-related protein n=1 Tax=Actinomadura kijaniata TaxID=46161 RepID=UPI003F1C56AD
MTDLFTASSFRVEQPRRGPFARTRYKILAEDGTLLAQAAEPQEGNRLEHLRKVFPGKSELDARVVDVTDPDGEPLLVIAKRAGRMLTTLHDADGETLGTVNTERIARRYLLRDPGGTKVGEIAGDVARRNFTVTDTSGTAVAHIRKKFAGIATHLLTTADKYTVEIDDPVPEPLRTFAVLTAVVMDMTLHESKDLT